MRYRGNAGKGKGTLPPPAHPCFSSFVFFFSLFRFSSTKGRYIFSWEGRAGASGGRVISESEHQKGRAIPHVSYSWECHTSFPEFFNENFCDVVFHFSYRLSFSFHLL